MHTFSFLFSTSVSVLLIFSGSLKLFSIKLFSKYLEEEKFIPKKFVRSISNSLPLVELILGIALLVMADKLVIVIAAIVFFFSLLLFNAKSIFENKQSNCYCYGNLLSSKTGIGGVIQCFLSIGSLIPSVIFGNLNYKFLFNLALYDFFIIVFISLIWTLAMILIRSIIEKTFIRLGSVN